MRSMMPTTRSTSCALVASTPFSSQILSSSPTRTLPPIATAAAAIGICIREMPNPTQFAPAGKSSFITFMVSTVWSAPQGMPRQIWNIGGSAISPSAIICLAKRMWPSSNTSSSGFTPHSLVTSAILRR